MQVPLSCAPGCCHVPGCRYRCQAVPMWVSLTGMALLALGHCWQHKARQGRCTCTPIQHLFIVLDSSPVRQDHGCCRGNPNLPLRKLQQGHSWCRQELPWHPNSWVQRDPTGLGRSRDTTLGCPHRQEGLAERPGVAGHWCHCPTVPQTPRKMSPPLSPPGEWQERGWGFGVLPAWDTPECWGGRTSPSVQTPQERRWAGGALEGRLRGGGLWALLEEPPLCHQLCWRALSPCSDPAPEPGTPPRPVLPTGSLPPGVDKAPGMCPHPDVCLITAALPAAGAASPLTPVGTARPAREQQ